MKCHGITVQSDDHQQIHWAASRSVPHDHQATTFAHAVHFSVINNKGCLTCHILSSDAEMSGEDSDSDLVVVHSNFQPISKTMCTTCHNPDAARDDCLTCHNYHVGMITPVYSSAPLTEPASLLELQAP